jgi:hypothetical protein
MGTKKSQISGDSVWTRSIVGHDDKFWVMPAISSDSWQKKSIIFQNEIASEHNYHPVRNECLISAPSLL